MTSEPVTRIKSKTPVPYELTAIHHDTHDTKTFCFALPDDATLDMLPGDHLYVHATIDGKSVKRPYTPSSMPGATGYFDLTVKRYETGVVSKYLHDREPGDTVLMSGPNPGGHWVDGMAKKVGFVAGGSGITPMIAIIRWILAKSLLSSCFWSLPTRPRPTSFSGRNGMRMSASTRPSIVIMCWSSHLQAGRKARAASPRLCCARICLRPVLTP